MNANNNRAQVQTLREAINQNDTDLFIDTVDLLTHGINGSEKAPRSYIDMLTYIIEKEEFPPIGATKKNYGGSALNTIITQMEGKKLDNAIKGIVSAYCEIAEIDQKARVNIINPVKSLIIPDVEDLTVLFKSTTADYGLSADLVFEYSRQDPLLAGQHAKTLDEIAVSSIKTVFIVGEGATRLVRSPYGVVSEALKRLCLMKTVVIDGVTYRGIKGALQIELAGLTQTSQSRAKAMLKGAISPRKATVEKNGYEWCQKESLSRLPESLRIWALEHGAFDGYELSALFSSIIGVPKVELDYNALMKRIDYAEKKINDELALYKLPPIVLSNKNILAEFLSSGVRENVPVLKCPDCNEVMKKRWKRCPFC